MDKKNEISFTTYRFMDLFIFTLLFVLFEIIMSFAVSWFDGHYVVSIFLALSLLIMRRWKFWAIVPIIIGTIAYCYTNGGTLNDYLVYGIGNLSILLSMLWFKLGREKSRQIYPIIGYVLGSFIIVELCRSLVHALLGGSFMAGLWSFVGSDLVSLLLALIIIIIARKQDGLFEDQKYYLKQQYAERQKQQNAETEVTQ